ncbi:MAG TPA: AIR synthase-related protein [Usitatibacter sp.]
MQRIHGIVAGAPPRVDLAGAKVLVEALLAAISAGAVRSAHDCADGGLAVALAESAMMERAHTTGAEIDLSVWERLPLRALLFGEAQGRVIVSTPDQAAVLAIAARHGVTARPIGTVRRSGVLDIRVGTRTIRAPLGRLIDAYHEAIPRIMQRSASAQDVALISDSVG